MTLYVYRKTYGLYERVNVNSYDPADETKIFNSYDEALEDYLETNKDYFCRWEIRR
jgi:hypothetical protein